MPKDFQATALERAVGPKLADWREERGLSLVEAGRLVGFSSAKLSMMENAIQPSPTVDVMALGYVYRVPTPEWQFVMSQAQHAADLRMFQQPLAAIFDPTDDFPLLIADATRLRTFTTDTVPTIFQLADYTAAITRRNDPAKAAQLLRVRKTWTTRSGGDDPLAVEAVFPEAVLRQLVGGRRVLKAQLLHLMEVSELPEVSLRVVAHSAGGYPAMSCPFTWLSFPHRQHNDVVYTETFLRSEYMETRAQVEQTAERFSALRTIALDENQSMELITEAATLI
ncbi:helix-turn-helix domain-containing protein [Lentzea flaviverrucosa]|uniref:Helix-turn-helix domain-containing protein n=1 Tax=Lentzea flaviverrucosa TaxID=200379 RepID=A0A1H9B7C9_9PSEU|nr:helix-turn-helix transcriptional regulator [Lentzea flaviverrucosa]RDI31861.1 helix-turn-helix protein [Lentzea flaviverrucosa]SEP84864.1 Helix-turn-helix domain-containing protein [Lentzea flaviverrucosa]